MHAPHLAPRVLRGLLLLPVVAVPLSAQATELTWDGFYRGRGLVYDSLSLSDTNNHAEGTADVFDHRLSLRPTFVLSEHAAIHAQVELLAYTTWGDNPDTYESPLTGAAIATAEADGVATSGAGIQATRAWGEAFTPIGRFAMGRMPMQWGAGILWNDGDDVEDEYGDTADRVQFNTRAGPVFVMAAWDLRQEGYVGEWDDMAAVSLAVGYRSETAGVGLLNNYEYQPWADYQYQAYTGDLWGFAELGPVRLQLEAVGIFGGGNLDTGANDISIMSFGGMLDGSWQGDALGLGVEGGFATGDEDPTDEKLTTFSFDRDHDIALLLFEEPMPTLASNVNNEANQGRDLDAVLTGDGVSNALYMRPYVTYRPLPGLTAELAWVGARLAKGGPTTDGREGYGNEFDLSVRYDPHPHVWVKGTLGLLLPGDYYKEYEHDELGGGFDKAAIGGRIVGAVEF